MKRIPTNQMTSYLRINESKDHSPSGFVRVRGNTRASAPYANDLAYLADNVDRFVLWFAPRQGPCPLGERPPQQLSLPIPFRYAYEREPTSPPEDPTRKPPKGMIRDERGYWGIKARDRRLYRRLVALPSAGEVTLLKDCKAVPKATVDEMLKRISQVSISVNDRVIIHEHLFDGLVGHVVEISDQHYNVYIPSQDITTKLFSEQLRKQFQIGDMVSFGEGNQMQWGWLVRLESGSSWAPPQAIVLVHNNLEEVSTIPCPEHSRSCLYRSLLDPPSSSFMRNRSLWLLVCPSIVRVTTTCD